MLELKVYDGDTEVVLQFEHSLLALSKWESKHKKAFLATPTKTSEDLLDYFQCMIVSHGVDETLIFRLSPTQLDNLSDYINEPQTASSVPQEGPTRGPSEVVTSELIYYWMTALQIPFEVERWHLSRLMMLIQIANYKQQPEKKRKIGERLADWRDMNAENKKKFGTTG